MRTHLLYLSMILFSCGGFPPDVPSGKNGQTGAQGTAGIPGKDGKDAVVAGSRLRPLDFVGADGTRIGSAGWFFDSQRNERCGIQWLSLAPDGIVVCAPVEMAGKLTAENIAPYVRFSLQ